MSITFKVQHFQVKYKASLGNIYKASEYDNTSTFLFLTPRDLYLCTKQVCVDMIATHGGPQDIRWLRRGLHAHPRNVGTAGKGSTYPKNVVNHRFMS